MSSKLVFLIIFFTFFQLCFLQSQQTIQAVPLVQTSNYGYQPDGSMDLTFAKTAQQKNQFIETAGKVQPGTLFLQHLFECDGDDDFHFSLPVQQQIALYIYNYVSQDNTYVRVKNVTQQPPIRMAIYEGQNNLIVRSDFFFQKYIVFNGKKDTKYLLKFQTSGKLKLISLNLKLFVQVADIKKNLQKSLAQKYSSLMHDIKNQILQISNKLGVYWIIDENNLRHTVLKIEKYYFYEILEMIVVLIASYVQVSTIFKLLKGNSIIV